ncbi:MAG: hypothetical protein GY811_20990 [Myxococcales bacterium]|nr:hypothetical protein [Myxococcales bacterium]
MGIVSAFRRIRVGDLPDQPERSGFPAIPQPGIAALALAVCTLAWPTGPALAESPAQARTATLLATSTSPLTSSADKAAGETPPGETGETIAGFRMEGGPRLEVVFGDITGYKSRIDRFTELQVSMESQRRRFANATHQVQTTLGPSPKLGAHRQGRARVGRACPKDAIAQSVAAATDAHRRFRLLGIAFEQSFIDIRDLHSLGESAGLTPDYRGRVLRGRTAYRQALSDMSEMNAVIRKQMEPELKRRGCTIEALVAYAETAALADSGKHALKAGETKPPVIQTTPKVATVQARAVTFFVDNRACSSGVDVYVDATLLGHVAPGTHAAFQSLSGRHSLCTLEEGSVATCGDTGTVRTAFVHDGFRLQRSCGE